MQEIKPYLQKLTAACPELVISSARFDVAGMNNIVLIINEDIVFRFPRYMRGLVKLREETQLLLKLAGLLPLPIPQPSYIELSNVPEQSFCGYKMLPGESLQASRLSTRPDLALALAGQLGTFLHKLHSLPPKQLLLPDSQPRRHLEHWQDFFRQVREGLFEHMRPSARAEVADFFREYLHTETFKFGDTLIHGDFGPSNILWDGERGVTGIIDFGSAGWGDPAQDIASLMGPRGYGLDFVKLLKNSYPGAKDLIFRAQFYIGTFALQDALHGLVHNDREAFLAGIAPYV